MRVARHVSEPINDGNALGSRDGGEVEKRNHCICDVFRVGFTNGLRSVQCFRQKMQSGRRDYFFSMPINRKTRIYN